MPERRALLWWWWCCAAAAAGCAGDVAGSAIEDAAAIVDALAPAPDAADLRPAFCRDLPPAVGPGLWQSSRVRYGADGRLTYVVDDDGHRVPDFSYAGYHHGAVALPEVAEVARLGPAPGDATARIQEALDAIGARSPDARGHRGALVLEPGVYEIHGTVRVGHAGVVLRGSGQGGDPAVDTILVARGDAPHQRTVVVVGSGNTSRNWREGTKVEITTERVPVGALGFEVEDAAGFAVGDPVLVRHPATPAWIAALGGGGVINDAPWSPGTVDIVYYRRIAAIDGDAIELDAPVYNHLDRALSRSTIAWSDLQLVAEVGVENLRIDIETGGGDDEDHAWNAIGVYGAQDAWVRDVTALHFGYAGVLVVMSSRVTVDGVTAIEPVAQRTGGRMYNLSVDHGGQLVLFTRCHVADGRHGYVTNGTSAASGVVFHRSTATNGGGSEAGHRMWAQGILYDNLVEANRGQVLLMNRGDAGTSHGWAAAHSVVWNYNSEMVVQQPPTAQNYVMSQAGFLRNRPYNPGPDGHIEIDDSGTLVPPSLYEAQLCDRLR